MIWLADVAVAALIAWRYKTDKFASLNKLADSLEDKLPYVLTWRRWGNPITWLQHTLWAAAFVVVGTVVGTLLADWHQGALHFAAWAFIFYAVREWPARNLDGLMDQLGPLLLLLGLLIW